MGSRALRVTTAWVSTSSRFMAWSVVRLSGKCWALLTFLWAFFHDQTRAHTAPWLEFLAYLGQ